MAPGGQNPKLPWPHGKTFWYVYAVKKIFYDVPLCNKWLNIFVIPYTIGENESLGSEENVKLFFNNTIQENTILLIKMQKCMLFSIKLYQKIQNYQSLYFLIQMYTRNMQFYF